MEIHNNTGDIMSLKAANQELKRLRRMGWKRGMDKTVFKDKEFKSGYAHTLEQIAEIMTYEGWFDEKPSNQKVAAIINRTLRKMRKSINEG